MDNKQSLMLGGGLAALAVAALLIAGASGVFSIRRAEVASAPVLTAPVPQIAAPANVLVAPSVAAPSVAPVLNAPQTKGNPMPAEVAEYLRWLKQFEAGRQQLSAQGEAKLMLVFQDFLKEYMTGQSLGLLADDPSENTPAQSKGPDLTPINAVIQDWNKATGIFQQKSPPPACAGLAGTYNGALGAAVAQMSQLVGVMQSATQSVQQAGGQKTGTAQDTLANLMAQKSTKQASQSVDQSFQSAAQQLDALRDQYTDVPGDISKANFFIKTDGASVSLPGLPF